jgi:hypothetical protein
LSISSISLGRRFINVFAMIELDKRKSERFDLKLPTKLSWSGKDKQNESIELITSNVCSGGAYLATESPLPKGTEVNMDMLLNLDRLKEFGGRQSRIDVSGFVVRTDLHGMAICFDRTYKISPY